MAEPNVLITGVCGFSGRHLLERLRAEGKSRLAGLDLGRAPTIPVDGYFPCDLNDAQAVRDAVFEARPDVVYHLAGLIGFAPEEEMQRVNVGGFRSLVAALRQYTQASRRPVRLLVMGSAGELGSGGARQLPVTEDAPCLPETAYGRSKWEVTRLALAEPANSPVEMIVARPFNLVGPGLSELLALGRFVRQIAAVAVGRADAVRCGRLDTRRDYLDVRDAVNAYVLLAEQARPGLYNVCAGRSYLLRDLLDELVQLSGREIPILEDSEGQRPGNLLDIYGDHGKLTREVGWEPLVPIPRSLADMLGPLLIAADDEPVVGPCRR